MKKVLLLFLLVGAFFSPALGQKKDTKTAGKEENMIYSKIGEAPVGGGFSQEGYWVWGSSVVKGEDGLYHMFVSRWPKQLIFHPGWMVASEIVHATAKDPAGPYTFSDVALPARGPEYWDGRATHNPRIIKHQDTYVLFYMGSTHPFDEVLGNPDTVNLKSPYATVARQNKRIGIATAKSPYGPWERRDAPVLDVQPNTFYSFLTSNPAPWINEDGSAILVFKSRAHKKTFPYETSMMIGVAKAPHFTGPYTVVGKEPIFGEKKVGEIEDPYLWRDQQGYHMIAKDQRGAISGHKHAGILVHSDDGVTWRADKNPLAYSKTIRWDDGKTQTMGQLERAFILMEDGVMTHMFFATMDGPGGFNNATRSWNMSVKLKQPGKAAARKPAPGKGASDKATAEKKK
jgi:hypothetical protein